ncbi:helix-turn-helix domain-containing protein [Streptomyces sp. NPDC005393]|uniref:helix-turn-helix domain-containing protein n=1 Tax=Streptomyces sp. NPDC005393 TaxID=3157041 RepID=UPI0033B87D46
MWATRNSPLPPSLPLTTSRYGPCTASSGNHTHGATVASYIRRQRLARARRDLADPCLATRPVHAIAARWGFLRPADFTRAFRTIYGSTPTEYRHGILRADAGVHR